jgi:hypothetical protein
MTRIRPFANEMSTMIAGDGLQHEGESPFQDKTYKRRFPDRQQESIHENI